MMACPMRWSMIVLPVRGGATMRQRWPLPMGMSRSMTRRSGSLVLGPSSLSHSVGSIVTRLLKSVRWTYFSGGPPSMDSMPMREGR